MSNGTPRPDVQTVGLPIPEPEPADYSDELSAEDVAALRQSWNQDESQMGGVVHEFSW